MRILHKIPPNTIDDLHARHGEPAAFSHAYLEHLTGILAVLDRQEISAAIRALQDAYRADRQVFFIGNGGSASTASHFAVDLAKGTKVPGLRPFRATSLTDNVAYLTAQANDEGYDSIFVAQLENLLRPGDVVVGITASGNSQNLIDAFIYAKTQGATTVGLLGFDGGKLKDLSDRAIIVRTSKGEYGPVEEIHLVLDHIITNYLGRWLASCAAEGL